MYGDKVEEEYIIGIYNKEEGWRERVENKSGGKWGGFGEKLFI